MVFFVRISQWKQMMTIKSPSWNVRFVANISREYICLYASILVQLLKHFARFHLRVCIEIFLFVFWRCLSDCFHLIRQLLKQKLLLSIVTTFISKWVPMNFDGTERKLRKGSHDLWEQNRKIVYYQIWNPRACSHVCIVSLCFHP